ncbi:MAG: signal peptidase I [Ruminococcus sp.]|nr:signal peptidase I [Ruminococcus sp.]
MDELELQQAEAEKKEEPEKKGNIASEIFDWFDTILCSVIAVIVIFTFFTRLSSVDGSSMNPTLIDQERLLITNVGYTPKHNDIVVVWAENLIDDDGSPGKAVVKRVVGIGGDKIRIDFDEGVVYRNDEALPLEVKDGLLYEDGHTINDYTRRPLDFGGEVTVPEGYVFVLGDNRNNSRDSRDSAIGLVDERFIAGRVYLRVAPFDKFGGVN